METDYWTLKLKPNSECYPEGSGRQGKVEGYCCNVICGAPTAAKVKGLRWDEIRHINKNFILFITIFLYYQYKIHVYVFGLLKLGCVSFYAYILSTAWLFIHAEIRTKRNTNIKNSLIRICDMVKNHTDKGRQIKYTHKRKRSLIHPFFYIFWFLKTFNVFNYKYFNLYGFNSKYERAIMT